MILSITTVLLVLKKFLHEMLFMWICLFFKGRRTCVKIVDTNGALLFLEPLPSVLLTYCVAIMLVIQFFPFTGREVLVGHMHVTPDATKRLQGDGWPIGWDHSSHCILPSMLLKK